MPGADAGGREVTPAAAPFGASDELADPLFGYEMIVDRNTAPEKVCARPALQVSAHDVPAARVA